MSFPASRPIAFDARSGSRSQRPPLDALRAHRALQRAERADQEQIDKEQERDAHAPQQDAEGELHY